MGHDTKITSRSGGLIVNGLTSRRNHTRLLMRAVSRCVAKDAAENARCENFNVALIIACDAGAIATLDSCLLLNVVSLIY